MTSEPPAILYADDHILVACKPPYMPVIPAGRHGHACLVFQLRALTGNPLLVPLNRLDYETAGLVLCSTNPATRGRYGRLFQNRQIRKRYAAIGHIRPEWTPGQEWHVAARIVPGAPWFRRALAEGPPNSWSHIRLCAIRGGLGLFDLTPLSGKTHQLRLHVVAIGGRIVNDPLYPELRAEPKPSTDAPLGLLASELAFRDPLTGAERLFRSPRRLDWPPTETDAG